MQTAAKTGFPTDHLIFEFTENEQMVDAKHVQNIVDTYRTMGFGVAIDDFGAGHAGLGLLARFQPDLIKLDMELIRDLDMSLSRRLIIDAVVKLGISMGFDVMGWTAPAPAIVRRLPRLRSDGDGEGPV